MGSEAAAAVDRKEAPAPGPLCPHLAPPHHGSCDLFRAVPIQIKPEGHHLAVVGLQLALDHSVILVGDLQGQQREVVKPSALIARTPSTSPAPLPGAPPSKSGSRNGSRMAALWVPGTRPAPFLADLHSAGRPLPAPWVTLHLPCCFLTLVTRSRDRGLRRRFLPGGLLIRPVSSPTSLRPDAASDA